MDRYLDIDTDQNRSSLKKKKKKNSLSYRKSGTFYDRNFLANYCFFALVISNERIGESALRYYNDKKNNLIQWIGNVGTIRKKVSRFASEMLGKPPTSRKLAAKLEYVSSN